MTLEEAYSEACRQIGHLTVQLSICQSRLASAEAERDEAGARIVEMTSKGPGS